VLTVSQTNQRYTSCQIYIIPVYLGNRRFETRPEHRLSWLFSNIFLSSSRQIPLIILITPRIPQFSVYEPSLSVNSKINGSLILPLRSSNISSRGSIPERSKRFFYLPQRPVQIFPNLLKKAHENIHKRLTPLPFQSSPIYPYFSHSLVRLKHVQSVRNETLQIYAYFLRHVCLSFYRSVTKNR
jgi:hypothetical protein